MAEVRNMTRHDLGCFLQRHNISRGLFRMHYRIDLVVTLFFLQAWHKGLVFGWGRILVASLAETVPAMLGAYAAGRLEGISFLDSNKP